MQQRSPEWHAFRKGKIGASQSGTVMGLNPYQTPLQLYNEMKGFSPPRKITPAMQKGIDLEDSALQWLMNETCQVFSPQVGTYEKNERIIASLDGLSWDSKTIAEIKCSQKIYDKAKRGEIDPMYMAQINQQMLVFDIDNALFVAYDGRDGVIIKVKRDEELISKILEAELEFLECLDTDIPPAAMEKDHVRVVLENDDVVKEWMRLKEQADYYTKLEKEIRPHVEALGDSGNMELCDAEGKALVRLTRVQRAGNVNWKNLCADRGISDEHLEPYRSPQIGFYKFTQVKQ